MAVKRRLRLNDLTGAHETQAGNRVRPLRAARGWSQAELARRSEISRAAVSAIETYRLVPSVAVALKLAGCFGCPVEDLFGSPAGEISREWAWPPATAASRYWLSELGGRCFLYPVEETVAGELAHDGVRRGDRDQEQAQTSPSETLIVAGCDPAASLLASQYNRQTGLRMIVLGRSSGTSLDLLRRGLIHVAGVHLAGSLDSLSPGDAVQDSSEPSAASPTVGPAFRFPAPEALPPHSAPASLERLRLARWEEGVALSSGRPQHSLRSALRGPLRWVGRENGSGARQCLDQLLGPKPFKRVARNHRGVADAVRAGWADAGVCVRLVSEEAGLQFFSVRDEHYDLVFSKTGAADPRIQALIRVVRSGEYRRLLGELPGYDVTETGSLG